MKILFFNYEYPPLGGGAANATAYILAEYAKISELSVDLITSSIDGAYHLEKIGENVRIHRLSIGKNSKNLHFQSQKDIILYTIKAYWFARKLCKENNFNLSHSFFTVPCGFVSLVLKKQFKLPFIISLRGSDVPGYSDRFPLIYAFLKPIFRLIWREAGAVISNSKGLKELALKTNPKQKIDVIYNGIDIEKFKPDENLKNKEKFIITPGASRITDRKGLNYLIEAVSGLSEKYPQIYLKIMGEGNALSKLEELVASLGVKNRVEFLGRIPREKTSSYYQEASLFVLPSLNEGMSNAMLEALASGLPLVSTNTGGASELVADGKNGFIVKFKDSKNIAEKIEKLINDPELAKNMGNESRKIAEKMSWEGVAQKYFELYKKI
jgi:glycosyltransferase involved in cell wall biosynthesis